MGSDERDSVRFDWVDWTACRHVVFSTKGDGTRRDTDKRRWHEVVLINLHSVNR